jgi:hypothetical protein
VSGLPTLIIVRNGLYLPETSTCRVVGVGILMFLGVVIVIALASWLWNIESSK